MSSIWFQENNNPTTLNPLTKDLETEVAVIGGGLCGILTAYLLQESGVKVILLTRDNIGDGQSGNNTGKLTAQHGLIYTHLKETFGSNLTKQYANANLNAIKHYKNIIEKENISCDLEETSAFLYSEDNNNELLKEWNTLKDLDIKTSFLPDCNLPFPTKGAIRWEQQYQLNPVKLLSSLSRKIKYYTNCSVIDVKENTITTNTSKVTAEKIVFACHIPIKGLYFPRIQQSRAYVIAVENGQKLDGMYIGTKETDLSLRNYKNYTLLCGQDHPTGKNRLGGNYAQLEGISQILFKNSKLITSWSAQDGITIDRVPYIGSFSPLHPHWYVATGFGKWGISTSMVAAHIISSQICDKPTGNADIFAPNRLPLSAIPNLLHLGKNATAEISRELFSVPSITRENLPQGHGGIVETVHGKVGIYKDKSGKIHQVSTRCTHLGGQLSWNPDDKSWDCPCHGSRFNTKGQILDGPATKELE